MATSQNRPLGLVIPTHWEAGVALRRFGFQRIGPSLYTAVISGRMVFLCISGVGREAARRGADRLVSQGSRELVSMGFCGALIPDLKVGTLVTDRMATVDRPARTPREREAITGRAHAVAVDMETQAIIEAGTRHGVPIQIRRIVSDEFMDDLTPLFGFEGGFSVLGIAFRLLHPRVWPLAWRLYRQSRIAAAKVADVLGDETASGSQSQSNGAGAALALFVLFWILYQGTLARVYSYDGILYALDVEFGSLPELFHPGHLLYSGLVRQLFSLSHLLGYHGRALYLMQSLNAFIGAVAVALFAVSLSRKCGRRAGILTAALFGVSHGFWSEAIDPGCYALAGLGAVCLLAVLLETNDGHAFLTGLFHGGMILLHQMLVLAVPAFLVAWFLKSDKGIRSSIRYCLGVFVGAILPYGLAAQAVQQGSWPEKLKWAIIPAGTPSAVKILDNFWWTWAWGANLKPSWDVLAQSLAAPGAVGQGVALILGAAVVAWSVWVFWRRTAFRKDIVISWIWILSFGLFLFFFHHAARYAILFMPPLFYLLAALLGEGLNRPWFFASATVGLCILGMTNYSRAVAPRRLTSPDQMRLLWVRDHLRPVDFFLFTGRGPKSVPNVYVAYFASEIPARSIYGYLLTQYKRPDARMDGLTAQVLAARLRGGTVWVEEGLLDPGFQRKIESDAKVPDRLVRDWFKQFKGGRRHAGPGDYALVELIPAFQAR